MDYGSTYPSCMIHVSLNALADRELEIVNWRGDEEQVAVVSLAFQS